MKLEADSRLGGQKDEARLLGKVSLDTWRFILGYIAKYHWILFRGSFLARAHESTSWMFLPAIARKERAVLSLQEYREEAHGRCYGRE